MRKYFFLFAALLLPIITLAQHRSEGEAISVAREFWGKSAVTPKPGLQPANPKVVSQSSISKAKARIAGNGDNSGKQPGYYIVNDETNNRFVIVSADERLYTILGYSDNGVFDADSAPDGLLGMLVSYDRQYSFLAAKLSEIQGSQQRKASQPIAPIIQTAWDQLSPYNDLCPKNKRATDNSNCASGCVATAMAQVMNYFQYPAKGQGFYTYQSATQKHSLALDFSSTTFDWNKISDVYDDESTEAQKAEVAKLMYACGVSVSMDYGSSADGQSGAAPTDIPYAMIKYFGYNPNINYKNKDYYTPDEWESLIMTELQAGHPVLYGGFDSNNRNGHRFILDGCDNNGLYHFNFGWTYGFGNGYYSLELLKPNDVLLNILAGRDVELGDFSYNQSMICNVSPVLYGEHEDIFYLTDDINLPSSVNANGNESITFKAKNYSAASSTTDTSNPKFSGSLGIGLFDSDFRFIKSLAKVSSSSKQQNTHTISCYVKFDKGTFSDGSQYYIAPYAQGNGAETPTRIRGKQGSKDYYLAQTINGVVTLIANGTLTPYELTTGSYIVSVNGGEKEWQIELAKDNNNQEDRYVISNFDPAVNEINEVYAYPNPSGTQLTVYLNQNIQENTHLYNIADPDKIVISVNAGANTMYINDTWGSVQIVSEGENTTQRELSRYSNTRFSLGTLDPSPSIVVSSPVISISQETNRVTLLCGTDNARIYYTIDGSTPTAASTLYTGAFTINHNCVIKCAAILEGTSSDVVTKTVKWFTMSKPSISMSADNKSVIMESDDKDAAIYYTVDGTTPTRSGSRYTAPIPNSKTTTYKAIAVKENFNDSPVETFVAEGSGNDDLTVVVTDNKAGELANKVNDANKFDILCLTITGQLNGTDIKYLREILQQGKLAKLDLSGASIVSGGEKYDGVYSTKDNVITEFMFDHSKSLMEISLPDNIMEVKSFALAYCPNLTSFTVPASCTAINEYALSGSTNIERFAVNDGNIAYKAIDGILFSADGKTICKVPFAKDISNYAIPNSVTIIGNKAFENTNIAKVTFPSTLQKIGNYAFEDCKYLAEVVLPDNITELGEGAFQNCKGLLSVSLSNSIAKLDRFTFSYCVSLRTIFIPKSVISINAYALTQCLSLQNIDVDNENPSYCSYSGVLYSRDMKSLITYPVAMESNEYYVADGVEKIGSRAFSDCSKIQDIILPSSVTEIGSYAFEGSSLHGIVLPDNIHSIGDYAFSSCDSLQSLSLPESLKEISNGLASYSKNLSYLRIPADVNYIGLAPFRYCKSLEVIESLISDIDKVEFRKSSLSDEIEAFEYIPEDCTWHVPAGCGTAYKSQPWWVSTWKVVEEDNSGISTPINTPAHNDMVKFHISNGFLTIEAYDNISVNIFDVMGTLVESLNMPPGMSESVSLPSGIYIINGKKILVK